jgi:hypothetical protein
MKLVRRIDFLFELNKARLFLPSETDKMLAYLLTLLVKL